MTVSETTVHTKRTTVSFSSSLQTNAEYITPTDVGSSTAYFVDDAINRTDITGVTSVSQPCFLDMYTTRDHATSTYVRNPDFWLKKYTQQLTCRSVWTQDSNDNQRLTTLITPRHSVSATHAGYAPDVGTDVRFVTADNQVITRTVLQQYDLPDSDITVCLLDSDVPSSISPAKLLPKQFYDMTVRTQQKQGGVSKQHLKKPADYEGTWIIEGYEDQPQPLPPTNLPENSFDNIDRRIPVVYAEQRAKLFVADYVNAGSVKTAATKVFTFGTPLRARAQTDYVFDQPFSVNAGSKRTDFANLQTRGIGGDIYGNDVPNGDLVVPGDSGNPAFIPAGDELWLASTHTITGRSPVATYWDQTLQAYYYVPVWSKVDGGNYAWADVQSGIDACDAAEGVDTGYVVQRGNIAQFSRR
jgi:hypothetical protein